MRISELGMQQLLLQGFQRAQDAAQQSQIQLASGKKHETYGGYGADALRLVSAEGVFARATAFENASQIALTRLELQGASLSTVSDAIENVRAGLSRTLAAGNSEQLMPQLEVAAQQILTALNAQFGGVYLFGGTDGSTAPVGAKTLGDIAAAGSADALFTDGERVRLSVEEGVSIDGGPLASEVARDLMAELQDLAGAEAALGPFNGALTDAQRVFIAEKAARFGEIADALYQELGVNALSQGQAADAADRNRQRRDLAEIVTADIENIDIAEAITQLNQDRLAIEASAQALAQATELSLLNYI